MFASLSNAESSERNAAVRAAENDEGGEEGSSLFSSASRSSMYLFTSAEAAASILARLPESPRAEAAEAAAPMMSLVVSLAVRVSSKSTTSREGRRRGRGLPPLPLLQTPPSLLPPSAAAVKKACSRRMAWEKTGVREAVDVLVGRGLGRNRLVREMMG